MPPKVKKKGPPKGALSALKGALEEQKKLEEELKRQEEEEERLLKEKEEEEKKEAERKLEEKRLKKEREKQKIAEQKKAGTYMTPAQKQAAAQRRAKLEAMTAAGMKVAALEEDGNSSTSEKKKVVYTNKKKQPKMSKKLAAVQARSMSSSGLTESSAASSLAGSNDQDNLDDESQTQSRVDEEEAALASAVLNSIVNVNASETQDSDNIKDSWDASSDEEADNTVKTSWDDEEEEEEEPKKEVAKPEPKKDSKSQNPTKKETKKPVSSKPVPKSNKKPIPGKSAKVEPEPESESESDSESDYSDEGLSSTQKQQLKLKEEAKKRRLERQAKAMAERSKDHLRSPICCILGHVDTGKTKLLDKIRQSNVQEGEAGGITQQIGATYFPIDAIKDKTAPLFVDNEGKAEYKVPGLLMIDTPGHESFTNLRSRGSSLCNIAVLVVDILSGLEQQTIESIGLLRARKTPFVVAVNKIDRIYGWQANTNWPSKKTIESQRKSAQQEFQDRLNRLIVEFAEQGLNARLYWENPNVSKYVSLIPTSAVTGEGVPDLLHLLVDLTQTRMSEKLMYNSQLECTIIEVKVVEGLGTTIDVVLSNGVLREGDKIVLCGLNGPIVTSIRALLTPQPMKEMRVKTPYVHHKEVIASLGVKIAANDLDTAIAGSRLMVITEDDDEEEIREEIMEDLESMLNKVDKTGRGVAVQASTLGSLEALLSFLTDMKIPISTIKIGPVHKKDIIRAGVMLDKSPEFAQLLAFDVPVDRDAQDLAAELGVRIFAADVIYHLFDSYTKFMKDVDEQKKKDAAPKAVFPAILKIVPGCVFNKRDPIILGVDCVEGSLRVGTPICVLGEEKEVIPLGKVVSIELNHKAQEVFKPGQPAVAIKIEGNIYDSPKMFGRHFTEDNLLYSHITRTSIDVLKENFRDQLAKEDWLVVMKLKKLLNVN